MEEFKARLVDFARKTYDMGQNRFEEKCGINRGVINSIKVKGPSADIVTKISLACPELNLNWLFTGEGSMLKENMEDTIMFSKTSTPKRTRELPILPFSAVAGALSENIPSSFIGSVETCRVSDFIARGADCCIRVDGDSMYPHYSNGEILAIRIIKDPTFFQWGKVYCLSTNQGCVIKKLFPDDNPEYIICHSENSANYPDYKIAKSDVLGVAVVVGHIGIE